MGIIYRVLELRGPRRKRRVKALFDTGSTFSLVRRDLAESLGALVELPELERFEMAHGTFTTRDGFVGSVKIGRAPLAHLFRVVRGLSEELILGADFLQEWHITLDPRRRKITLDPQALRLKAVGSRRR